MSPNEAKSAFRMLIGQLPDREGCEYTLIQDTNNSAMYYGCLAVFSGPVEFAEPTFQYLRSAFEPYSDCYQKRDMGPLSPFVSNLLSEATRQVERLFSERVSGGGQDRSRRDGRPILRKVAEGESLDFSLAVAVIVNGVLAVGRVNSISAFYLKDRKFSQIFGKTSGHSFKPEVETLDIKSGARLLICSDNLADSMTRLEIKNILNSEPDVDMVGSKVGMFASRCEDREGLAMILAGFTEAKRQSKGSSPKVAAATMAVLICVALVAYFMGDVAKLVQQRISAEMPTEVAREGAVEPVAQMAGTPRKYEVENIYTENGVPYDIAVDNEGQILIVDDKSTNIVVFEPVSGIVRSIGERLDLIFPTSILFKGKNIYVVDHSRNANRVYKLDERGGQELTIPKSSKSKDQLNQPKAIAVDGKGDMFICDRGSHRLLKVSRDGKMLAEMSLSKSAPGPNGITITKKGKIYITSKNRSELMEVEANGSARTVALKGPGGEPEELDGPSSLESDDAGRIYIADTGNRRVLVAEPDGRIAHKLDREVIRDFDDFMPMGLALDRQMKYLYIVGSNKLNYAETGCPDCYGKIWKVKL